MIMAEGASMHACKQVAIFEVCRISEKLYAGSIASQQMHACKKERHCIASNCRLRRRLVKLLKSVNHTIIFLLFCSCLLMHSQHAEYCMHAAIPTTRGKTRNNKKTIQKTKGKNPCRHNAQLRRPATPKTLRPNNLTGLHLSWPFAMSAFIVQDEECTLRVHHNKLLAQCTRA